MTPEELTELVENRNETALVRALSGLNEKQRKALSTTAQGLYRKYRGIGSTHAERLAHLAMLGTGPLSAALKYDSQLMDYWPGESSCPATALGQVLLDRRPDWLADWVDSVSERSFLWWATVEPLVEAGYLSPTMSDGVARAMGNMFSEDTSLADMVMGRTDLLEGVYRLIEIEAGVFDYYDGYYSSWPEAIVELCGKGHLDRSRILTVVLHGLLTPSPPGPLAGMTRFHDNLNPTNNERKLLEDDYLALLGSPNTTAIGLALKQLKALAKVKQLNAAAYFRDVPRVFQCSAKSHPKSALTLLKTVVKQQPDFRGAATLAAAAGLEHPHEDVQDAAMRLVETWAEPGDFQLAESLAAYRDQVAAPIQLRVDAVLVKLGAAGDDSTKAALETPVNAVSPAEDLACEIDVRRTEIDRLPANLRQKLGLDGALDAWKPVQLPPAADWTLFDAPLLTSLERLEPIQSLDELFDAVAHAIETVDHGDDVERILDGISRLCDQRPDDFERRAAPLVARINKCLMGRTGGLVAPVLDRGIAPLLKAWLIGSAHVAEFSFGLFEFDRCTWRGSLLQRLSRIAARVEQRVAAPLLATPTHRGGWIEPSAWAARWKQLSEFKIDVPEIEIVYSLLRMAPKGRLVALESAKETDSLFFGPLVWALGGEFGSDPKPKHDLIWIAASRCREPDTTTVHYDRLLNQKPVAGFGEDSIPRWAVQWSAMLSPVHLGNHWKGAVEVLSERIDKKPSTLRPCSPYLDPLFEPDRPLTELAAFALWIATLSKDADSRAAAIDAWIELIGDGRGDAALLGHVLVRLNEGGWLRLNRLADVLREVGRVSPLHAWTVAEVLQDLLASQETPPRDGHHVLQLLRELLVQLGFAIRPESASKLESHQGGGKTAKLAQQLAALPTANRSEPHEALLQLLDARIARAKRWSAHAG